MSYPNGGIPLHLLVHLGGEHYLPPGTAARWRWLVQAAYEKYGVRLRITQGPNAYRWYQAQVEAKEEACGRGRCQDAAAPGFSSHGGLFEGLQVMAVDVANWQDLGSTPSGKDAWGRFEALCRLAGFTVLFFDWEPWHITDFNDPWVIPAWLMPVVEKLLEEEADMPIVMKRTDTAEWSLLDPDVGTDLPRLIHGQPAKFRSEKTPKGVVNTYRGFMVTTDPDVGAAWSRTFCRLYQNVPQPRAAADYKAAQVEASRLSAEKHRS